MVSLALARPVRPDDMVTLSYLMDAMHPTRDAPAGRAADGRARAQRDRGVRSPGRDPAAGRHRARSRWCGCRPRRPAAWGRGGSTCRRGPADGLAGLTGLRELDLRNNAVTDLWPLAGLTNLQVLDLSGSQFTDLRPLAGLTGLQVLDLSGNQIADLRPLTGLDRLHRLDLSGNAVVDVSALGDVSGLVWLQLLGNPVSNAFLLGQIEQLRWLWLDAGTAAGM